MKLHLGCWHRNFPGFTNVDICDLPHIHYNSSIDKLPFIEDASVEYIYCSHALEYYDRFQAIGVLKEWYRVLKPGGMLRVAVPDFDKLLLVYSQTKDLKSILGPLFGRMTIEGKSDNNFIYHKTVYNFNLLKDLLQDTGFLNIELYDWKQTEHHMFDDHSQAYFPHLDKENGLLISLNIQCEK